MVNSRQAQGLIAHTTISCFTFEDGGNLGKMFNLLSTIPTLVESIQKVWFGSSLFKARKSIISSIGSLFFCLALSAQSTGFHIHILGIAQDAGYPQADCRKECCEAVHSGTQKGASPTSIAIIDKDSSRFWLLEASPEIRDQLRMVQEKFPKCSLAGILITHAHIGHYLGLAQLGREVMGAKSVPVYVLPRMKKFLETNGPWQLLDSLGNIELRPLEFGNETQLSKDLKLRPVKVPHRDEYSETAAFDISSKKSRMLFVPDIDSWDKWDLKIEDILTLFKHAFLDATFFSDNELSGRPMAEIPHPRVTQSMDRLHGLSKKEKGIVHFIHMNHTNPILRNSPERQAVLDVGFNISSENTVLPFP